MLTDTQWMRLEPLIEACRPKGKTPPQVFATPDKRSLLPAWLFGLGHEHRDDLLLRLRLWSRTVGAGRPVLLFDLTLLGPGGSGGNSGSLGLPAR